MREIGIDISQNQTQYVFDVFKSGELFAYAVTVCDESSVERCPIFPGVTMRLHGSFQDPAALSGTDEQHLAGTRKNQRLDPRPDRDVVRRNVPRGISPPRTSFPVDRLASSLSSLTRKPELALRYAS